MPDSEDILPVILRRLLLTASLALLAGCASVVDIGEACSDSDECMAGLSCIAHVGGAEPQVCMQDCVPSTDWICTGGRVCLMIDATDDRGVCYFGGALPAGASCLDRDLECEAGTACIIFEAGVRAECRKACRTGGTDCADGETCAALAGSPGGYCEPAT